MLPQRSAGATEMSEASWNAAVAEIRKVVGPIEGVETKTSLGFHSAITLTPTAVQARIGPAVKAGLAKRATFTPYKPRRPLVVDVTFKHYLPAEVLAYLPMFERSSAHSVRFRPKDMAEAVMQFISEYRADLTP